MVQETQGLINLNSIIKSRTVCIVSPTTQRLQVHYKFTDSSPLPFNDVFRASLY